MSGGDERRAHAEALARHQRHTRLARFQRQAVIMLASIALGMVASPYALLDRPSAQAASGYWQAKVRVWLTEGMTTSPTVTLHYDGKAYRVLARVVLAAPAYQQAADRALSLCLFGALAGFALWLSGLFALRGVLKRRRERLLQDRVIGGTQVASEKQLAWLARGDASSGHLTIGSVPLPQRLETRHLAMIGTTGAGKTTALRQLLDRIEARGEPALVYDTSGEFVAQYYRPERGDIILNPFDARCSFWSPFAEIAHPADADRIARQLISETGQKDSDVWLETSRILVANMLRKLWQEGDATLSGLLDALQLRSKDDLKHWLAGTSSARTFADDADRATGSVLFMLAKAANLIQFLKCEDEAARPFAFRDFIHRLDRHEGARPWIFVPRKEDYFEASKPLLACWLECAASAVLGLAPSPDRRIWFILDELADLPRVDNLARLLPEGRKFGAAVVLTFQALGQMQYRYGPQIAEAMLGCCNSKLFLQTVDSETRRWASQTIGTCEVEIATMSDALGDGEARTRTTLGRIRQTRPAVLESELRLPKHTGYLLLPDNMPVARIRLTADHIAKRGAPRHPGFVPADMASTLWAETGRAPSRSSDANAAGSPSTSDGPV